MRGRTLLTPDRRRRILIMANIRPDLLVVCAHPGLARPARIAQGAAMVATGDLLDNRYHLLEVLGEGGHAVVYLAEDRATGDHVAAKVLKAEFVIERRARERFRREAEIAARFRHPHILPVHERGEHHGTPYLIADWVGGGGLHERSADAGPPDLATIAGALHQLAAALDHLHEHDILHCDVKPANILAAADGRLTLTDFGIAQELHGRRGVSRQHDGTIAYTAPEVLDGWRERASDRYALGCTLYELLTGVPPYGTEGDDEVARAHRQRPIPLARRPDGTPYPPAIQTVMGRALAKEPSMRYQTAGELAEAFAAACDSPEAKPAAPRARLRRAPRAATRPIPPTVPRPEPQPVLAEEPAAEENVADDDPPREPRRDDRPAFPIGWVAGVIVVLLCAIVFGAGAFGGVGARGVAVTPPRGAGVVIVAGTSGATATTAPAATAAPTGTPRPAASGDLPPGELLYTSEKEGAWALYLLDIAAGTERRLTPLDSHNRNGVWSPDGRAIAFVSERDGNDEIYLMDAGGGEVRRLTTNPATDESPSWSPDGRFLAYTSGTGDARAIRLLRLGDTTSHPFVAAPAGWPTWQDDQTIVFSRPRAGGFALYATTLDAPDTWPLPEPGADDETPAASRDGASLAFSSGAPGGARQIIVARADGSARRAVTAPGAGSSNPAWSPDGTWLAYAAGADGDQQLFLIRQEGGPARPLTTGPSTKWYLAWRP